MIKNHGKDLSTNDFTNNYKVKLDMLKNYDDTEIRKNISNISIEQDTQKNKTEKLEYDNESIKNILPSVKATGEEIKLSNTAEAILKKVKVSGNSKQETRDGKNKFNLDYIRQPFSNFKITDTGVNITKCWVADLYTSENVIKTFKPNTTYTMKVKAKVVSRPSTMTSSQSALFALHRTTSGDLPSVWRECISMPDKETIALNKEKEYITTFTTPADMTNVRFLTYTFYGNNDGSTTGTVLGEIDVSEIMLVEGSYTSETFPEFELYGVTPTPNCPSLIRNVGDNINIFDKSNVNKLSAYFWSGSTIQTLNTRRIIYVPCKPNTMYSVSKKAGKKFILSTTKVTPALGVQTFEFVQEDTASLLSLKTPPDARYLLVQYFDTSADTLTEQEILDSIKIEEGVGTSYSPYNCGNINIIDEGKNFWNNQKFITGIPSANYKLTDTGFDFTRNSLTGGKYAYISINAKAGKTYTFSSTKTYEGDSPSLYLYKNIVYGTALKSTTDNYLTYTPTEDMTILFTIIIGGLVTSAKFTNIQIEERPTVTSYKPHQEQKVTFPLNEGQRLYKDGYLAEDGIHNKRTQIVLDGTENWDIRSDTHEMRLNLSSYNAIYGSEILCDKLVQATSYTGTGNKIRWVLNSQIICIYSEELNTANMTLNEWKQYLSENNLTIEIGITEVIEPYTSDQTQKFNEIQKLKSYSDETNICSTDEIKPIFDVEAFKDLETYIKEVIAMEVNA